MIQTAKKQQTIVEQVAEARRRHDEDERSSNKRATIELLAALVDIAIAHGRRHYSESGEPLATTLAVLECLQREGAVAVEAPGTRAWRRRGGARGRQAR